MKPNTQLRRATLIGTATLLLTGCFSPDEVAYQIYTEVTEVFQ